MGNHGTVECGIGLSFFKERLNFTADIYRKTTRDLLLEASLPLTSGSTVQRRILVRYVMTDWN